MSEFHPEEYDRNEVNIRRIQKAQQGYNNKMGNKLFVILLTLAMLTVGVLTAASVSAREITINGVTYHPTGVPTYTPTPPNAAPQASPPPHDPFCGQLFGYTPNVLQLAHSGDYIAADGTALALWGVGNTMNLRLLNTGGDSWFEGIFEYGSDDGPRSVTALQGGTSSTSFASVIICGAKFAGCNKILAKVALPGQATKNLLFLKEHTYDDDLTCSE